MILLFFFAPVIVLALIVGAWNDLQSHLEERRAVRDLAALIQREKEQEKARAEYMRWLCTLTTAELNAHYEEIWSRK